MVKNYTLEKLFIGEALSVDDVFSKRLVFDFS